MPNPFAAAARLSGARAPRADGFHVGGGAYAGAAGGRMNYDWLYRSLSVNQVNRVALPVLRDRANDLTMNNSSAAAVPRIFEENVVGKDGITLQAAVMTTRGDFHDTVNDRIEDAWYRWCEPRTCSVDRRLSFVDVETYCAGRESIDGEVLIRLVDDFANPFGFAVEVLDPAQLDHNLNRLPSPDGSVNAVIQGVEVDRWGAPVAYHLWANHPSEPTRGKHTVVPEEDIIHLFVTARAKQARGITWFAPVIIDLKMLGRYREAELTAALTAAAKQGWIVTDATKTAPGDPNADPDEDTYDVPLDLTPGSIAELPPGKSFEGWDPQHPVAAFDSFDKAILRSIATAVRIAYMSLTGDLSATSYGSGRIGLLAERAVYQKLQLRLVTHVHQRIYRRWLRSAMRYGALDLPSYNPENYDRVAWHPRTFPWLDPKNDLTASAIDVAIGGNSITRYSAANGRDFGEVMEEKAAEIALAKALGVPLLLPIGPAIDATTGAAAGAPAPAPHDTSGDASGDGADGAARDTDTARGAQRIASGTSAAAHTAARVVSARQSGIGPGILIGGRFIDRRARVFTNGLR